MKKLNDKDKEIFNNILEISILRITEQYVVNLNQVDINNTEPFLKNII